jgi:hypothetical protein
MLKKVFSWEYAIGIFLLFYGLGFWFWHRGSTSDSFKRLYLAAGLSFIFSLAWSLASLRVNDAFPWPRKVYSDGHRDSRRSRSSRSRSDGSASQSDEPPLPRRRRRRNKRLRKVLAACSTLLFIFSSFRLFTSYRSLVIESKMAVVEVFVEDSQRTRAAKVPFRANPVEQENSMFSLVNVPYKNVTMPAGGDDDEKFLHLNVILRNISEIPIDNAEIMIDSTAPIQSTSYGSYVNSSTEIGFRMLEMTPMKGSSGEIIIPVTLKLSDYQFKLGLLVSINGVNLRPYAAAVKLRVIQETGPEPAPASARH